MAVKKATYLGGQLLDTESDYVNMACNDDNGLYYIADPNNTTEAQEAFATHLHRVVDTPSPIWNQVVVHGNYNVTASSSYLGHITLQGLCDDGTLVDIMDTYQNTTLNGVVSNTFDLSASSSQSAVIKESPTSSAGGANTVQINMPLTYQNYESVDLNAAWYNDTSFQYRMALPIQKSGGNLHGKVGHTNDYVGMTIYVPYNAHMNADFSDLRFTATDGTTELAYYIFTSIASTLAHVIVMVPWYFIEKEREAQNNISSNSGLAYANTVPSYIYCYYGNAGATTTSDMSLGGQSFFYDDFNDNSLDTAKWTAAPTAHGTITESAQQLKIDLTSGFTEAPGISSSPITGITLGTTAFEMIVDITQMQAGTGTTANNGPIFRIQTGSDYFQCAMNYNK